MRRPALVLSLGFLVGGSAVLPFHGALFAGDPPALSAEEQTKMRQRIEDLASGDFRIREAATKDLIDMGEKARAALTEAMKSDSPAVRFRAEQILQRLDGSAKERPLDDGVTPGGGSGDGGGHRGGGQDGGGHRGGMGGFSGGLFGGGGFTDDQYEAWMAQVEKRMKELEEQMRRDWDKDGVGRGGLAWGPWFGNGGSFPGGLDALGARRAKTLRVDGGELRETVRGAKLVLTDPGTDGQALTTTYEGASLDAILAANPALREKAAVKALLEKKAALAKERETREQGQPGLFGGPGVRSGQARSIQIQSADGKTTVTITQAGPDGKPETKTYEGADLDTIKREHPELADALGGFQVHVERFGGTGPFVRPGPGTGFVPFPPVAPPPGQGGVTTDDEDAFLGEVKTGPFGLALGPVGDALRAHLGLSEGQGALVMAVRPDSDAAKLGLRAFDVIASVNGAAIASVDQVGAIVRGLAADAPLSMGVLRGGKTVTLER